MLKKPDKYVFELGLNGRYDEKGAPVFTKVCFIPKSIRVETNEKEIFSDELAKIDGEQTKKLRDELVSTTKEYPKETIVEIYLQNKNEDFMDIAKSVTIEDGKSKKEYEKVVLEKANVLKEEERKKLLNKEDLSKEINDIADKKCRVFAMSKAVTKTLLYTFSECIREEHDPSKKLFKDADDVEDSITESDMQMLCDKWKEFRSGMEENDAKK